MSFSNNFLKITAALVVVFSVVASRQFFSGGDAAVKNRIAPPQTPSVSQTRSFFPKSFESSSDVLPSNSNGQEAVKNSNFNFSTPSGQKPQYNLPLSDIEVFKIQHPPYYLDYLSYFEDLMIADGFLKKDQKQIFDSEDEVLSFWSAPAFDYLVANKVLAPDERQKFEKGLATVKALHEREATLLKGGVSASRGSKPLKEVVLSLAAGIFEFLGGGQVQAGDCYQSGPAVPKLGTNLTAPCCACHNVDGEPIGCLNRVCPFQGALYDQSTFICACAN